jgi:hypothetical protein
MIVEIAHNNINKNQWDEAVWKAPNGLVYAQYDYLNIVSPGWRMLLDENTGHLMPLPIKKKLFLPYLIQPQFCQQLGVIGSTSEPINVDAFLKQIHKRYLYYHLYLNFGNVSKQFALIHRHNATLSLHHEYAELRKNYSKQCLRNLKKAANANFDFRKDGNLNELIQLFEHFNNIRYKARLNYELLQNLVRTFHHEIRTVYFEDQLQAGALFLLYKNRRILLFSGRTPESSDNQAFSFLMDAYVQEHSGTDFVLDFEGSENPGLRQFYSSFGAESENYPCFVKKLLINR